MKTAQWYKDKWPKLRGQHIEAIIAQYRTWETEYKLDGYDEEAWFEDQEYDSFWDRPCEFWYDSDGHRWEGVSLAGQIRQSIECDTLDAVVAAYDIEYLGDNIDAKEEQFDLADDCMREVVQAVNQYREETASQDAFRVISSSLRRIMAS